MHHRRPRFATLLNTIMLAIAGFAGPSFAGTSGVPFSNELQKFAPFDGADGDHFGSDVVIDGDLMVIGARDDEHGVGSGRGSLYVYRRSAGVWTFEQKLVVAELQQVDFALLGISLDVDASANVIIAGASDEDHVLLNGNVIRRAGAAYVFRHAGGKWAQQQRLIASDAAFSDGFGRDVAVDGTRIVIGAHTEGTACDGSSDPDVINNCSSGAAYVFDYDGNVWHQTAKLVAFDTNVRDLFGESLDVQGDLIAVAAWNAGNTSGGCHPNCLNPNGHGAVYLYRSDGVNWTEDTILVGDNPTVGSWDNFGSDVRLSGEWLIAGASGDDDAALNAGAAYIFHNPGGARGTWTFHSKLVPPDGQLGDFLGVSVDIDGDLAVAGAESDDVNGEVATGSVYLWKNISGTWIFQGKLIASDANPFDFAGNWVSIEDHQAAVGVVLNDSTAPEAGAVYLYGSLDDCDGDGVLDIFQIADGGAVDADGDGVPDHCASACPADLEPDQTINVFDLFVLLSNWNSSGSGAGLAEPTNNVDVFDLFVLLSAWGPCE